MIVWLRLALIFEVANAAYLAGFDSASIFYHVQVVAHVAAGLILTVVLLLRGGAETLRRWQRSGTARARLILGITVGCVIAAVFSGLVLTIAGTATPYRPILILHIASSSGALLAAAAWSAARSRAWRTRRVAVLLGIAIAFPIGVRAYRLIDPPHVAMIRNDALPPLTPSDEGGGEGSPFFPSSARTVGDRLIPADFFLESMSCGNRGCHPDITRQWDGSMHHFSSFNNQWYRKSIEYMQEVVGSRPSKWCGGCHDQALLLTGKMDTPIEELIETPEAQAGIGCLVCHSIVHVTDTMGQGGYVLEYPEMHRLVASGNPLLKTLHDYMIRLDPGPHRVTMLKPFHRQSRAEFCSACHKVHLDVPVNSYRWLRGFDEYDSWQRSGVSGQGARSFYYPERPQDCADCHMPLVRSADKGNVDGYVHSHRFPAANTAVPFANRDAQQLQATREFLHAGILSVDIFAATPAGSVESAAPRAAPSPDGSIEAAPVAPLDRAGPFLRAGGTYRVDVVARTRNIGHAFPGGTIDAFDVWLELKVEDADRRVIFWSGFVEASGRGPVEPGAHRYGSLMIDAHGNPINKRNAWAARALVYARTIPPGAADVARFRVTIPEGARGPLTLSARMNHRKFSWWNTQFSYAGRRLSGASEDGFAPDFDDGRFDFGAGTSGVSGRIKAIPDLPITVIAEDRVALPLAGAAGSTAGSAAGGSPPPQRYDRERWNDYGIGMLLQGDLASALKAFGRVNGIDPGYADGFVNAARVLIREGDHEAAMPALESALRIDPDLASAHYFLGLTLKARGRYDEALDHFRRAAARYPRDVAVRNQIGRVLFLQRRHGEAIDEFLVSLAVDPEDVTAHYNLMLAYRAQGDGESERRHEQFYTRFKDDESAQEITGPYRRRNPDDNLERQPIHEHVNRHRVDRAGASRRHPVPGSGGS